MKKLAIVALALVLAMAFVGCGALASKAFIGEWEYDWGNGQEVWNFKEDGSFTWNPKGTVTYDDGKWVYDGTNVTISDFKDSYNGVWAVEFVNADEMKWTIVSYENPDFVNGDGRTNAEKQEAGENFTLAKVVADAE